MKNMLAILFLVAVIISSCCIDFGSSIPNINVQEEEKKETADVIVVEDITTIPKSPVFADQYFKLYFRLRNTDTSKTVYNVRVDMIDESIFGRQPEPSECDLYSGCDIPPMGEKIIYFTMKAPASEDIVNIETAKRVTFRVLYDFESTTVYDVVAINQDEVEKQQQAGKTLNIVSNKIINSGPVRIYPEIRDDDFLIMGTTGIVSFTLKNEGEGMLEDNKIKEGEFDITCPACPAGISMTGYALGKSFFQDLPIITGNAVNLITGMAAGDCPDGCGDEYSSVTDCPSGCPCFTTAQCGVGLVCGIDAVCVVQGSTTTVDVCSGCYGLMGGTCAQGCPCLYNQDCISGLYCVDGFCRSPTSTTLAPGCHACCGNGICQQYSDCPCDYACECDCDSECPSGSQCISNQYGMFYCSSGSTTTIEKKSNGESCIYNGDCQSGCCLSGICAPFDDCIGVSTTTPTTIPTTPTLPPTPPATRDDSWKSSSGTTVFECEGSGSGLECTNELDIDFFGQESSPLLFKISPSISADIYRIFSITARARYRYELRKYIDISILPVGVEE